MQYLFSLNQKDIPRSGKRKRQGLPVDQLNPDLSFDHSNSAAKRWLAYVTLLRRTREVLQRSERLEVL
jgi:hypothetical protein